MKCTYILHGRERVLSRSCAATLTSLKGLGYEESCRGRKEVPGSRGSARWLIAVWVVKGTSSWVWHRVPGSGTPGGLRNGDSQMRTTLFSCGTHWGGFCEYWSYFILEGTEM